MLKNLYWIRTKKNAIFGWAGNNIHWMPPSMHQKNKVGLPRPTAIVVVFVVAMRSPLVFGEQKKIGSKKL